MEYPYATISIGEETFERSIRDFDCQILCSRLQFQEWKQFIILKYFRVELNLSKNEPLPKIIEERNPTPKLLEEDLGKKYAPKNEQEKKQI